MEIYLSDTSRQLASSFWGMICVECRVKLLDKGDHSIITLSLTPL